MLFLSGMAMFFWLYYPRCQWLGLSRVEPDELLPFIALPFTLLWASWTWPSSSHLVGPCEVEIDGGSLAALTGSALRQAVVHFDDDAVLPTNRFRHRSRKRQTPAIHGIGRIVAVLIEQDHAIPERYTPKKIKRSQWNPTGVAGTEQAHPNTGCSLAASLRIAS